MLFYINWVITSTTNKYKRYKQVLVLFVMCWYNFVRN